MDESGAKLFEDAVDALAGLPGVGRKTAVRLALFLLKQDKDWVHQFGHAVIRLRDELKYCVRCHHLTGATLCTVCTDSHRDHGLVCVVEDIRDVMAIEATGQYGGVYHVLGGRISPMEGIGPSSLHVDSLVERVATGEIREVILALSATMEGDTTAFFVYRKIQGLGASVSTIARGIGFGDELQYADEVTLVRSLQQRLPFDQTLSRPS
jgi:recombination protein RecR